jgi:hypothetical protein|tara:strand:+ start:235 stop:492 length:258 start_codon:yes stop_codon:yes gene_type:complete
MSILFSPFRLVFSLVSFALEFAIVMAILYTIVIVAFIWLFGSVPEIITVTEYISAPEIVESVCDRIDGCRIFWDETGKEICPDCN